MEAIRTKVARPVILAALLLAAAWNVQHAAAADVQCPPGAFNPLGFLSSGFVLLSRYDAIDYNFGSPEDGTAEDMYDGVADLAPGYIAVNSAAEAVSLCASNPDCQAVNYADFGPHSFLKRAVDNQIINLLNGQGTGVAEDIGESTNFPNECSGLYVSTKGLDANSISCLVNNPTSAKAIMGCLKCGYAPEFANKRADCGSCVTNLRDTNYAYVEQCYTCRNAPLGFLKCRDCLANLKKSAHPEWSTKCALIADDNTYNCVMNNKGNAGFSISNCGL